MENKEYITIPQLAKIMGLSRIAIFKKVKNGEIKAIRIGHNYAISKKSVDTLLGKVLRKSEKTEIDIAVRKAVAEYGDVLKLLGRE